MAMALPRRLPVSGRFQGCRAVGELVERVDVDLEEAGGAGGSLNLDDGRWRFVGDVRFLAVADDAARGDDEAVACMEEANADFACGLFWRAAMFALELIDRVAPASAPQEIG